MNQSTRATARELIGRESELSWLHRLRTDVAAGRGGCVVVTGPAGIGKTELLRHAADPGSAQPADGPAVRVAHVVGTVTEQEWPYAGLHLVFSGLWATQLPERDAEPAALGGVAAGDLVGHFADGASTYEAARRARDLLGLVTRPVLLLVDDAHQLDRQSQEVMGFMARRLSAIPVGMVLATDAAHPVEPLHGLHTLRLGELSPDEATELVQRAGGRQLVPDVAAQLAARVGGNPRALLDIVGRVPDAQRTGRAELDRHLPPSPVLRALHLPDVDDLDPARRFALLVATGAEDGRMGPVLQVLRDHDESLTGWLVGEHLVVSGPGFTLRRPAVRSIIWQSATPAERVRAHEALAAAYADSDRGQQLWHLAQARHEDGELAGRLRRAARDRLERGELERALAFAREAVRLSPAGPAAVDGILLVARLAVLTGRFDEAVRLAQERFRRDTTVQQRADLALTEVQARILLAGEVATGLVTRHVAEVADADPDRAARLALTAAVGLAGRMEEGEAARFLTTAEQFRRDADPSTARLYRTAEAVVASVSGDPWGAADLLVDGTRAGEPAAAGPRPVADAAAGTGPQDVFAGAGLSIREAHVLVRAEQYDQARTLLEVITADGRFAGSPPLLGAAYAVLSALELRAGRIAAARTAASAWERAVSGAASRTIVPAHLIRVHALAGDEQAAWEWRRRSMASARRHGDGWAAALTQAETGGLLLLLGRLDEAVSSLDHARRYALQHADPSITAVEPDFIEACVRIGETARAAAALAEFEARVRRVPTTWARHALRRCQALVSEGHQAAALLESAAADAGPAVSPVELVRTQICLAEWWRRLGRRSEARRWFQRARALAHQTGALALAGRAEDELHVASTGGDTAVTRLGNLTESERRIASLVADGRRNREIAAELFVSVRTVEVHLGRIFRKVGVRSRTELASAVIAASDEVT